jgi:hypothetical protein
MPLSVSFVELRQIWRIDSDFYDLLEILLKVGKRYHRLVKVSESHIFMLS